MLATPSVQFLIEAHRGGALDGLVRAAHRHAARAPHEEEEWGGVWRRVRDRLHTLWPTRCAAAMGLTMEQDEHQRRAAATAYECPITLQGCIHPVVASDGHTYERDALLRFMAQHDVPVSPVTKGRITFLLYENYALRD